MEAVAEDAALDAVPAPAFLVTSAVFHYLGPAFAVLLFARVEPLGVAWLRIASAAAVFCLWRRPLRVWHGLDGGTRRLVTGWAVVLAAIAVRTAGNLVALVLAVAGVYLLIDVRLAGDWFGVLCTGLNAILFAGYVILGHRVARRPELGRVDGLALAMGLASVLSLPAGIGWAGPAMTDLGLLAAAAGVGICSSVIPYVCDQLAMARLSRATFALMLSLLPATGLHREETG